MNYETRQHQNRMDKIRELKDEIKEIEWQIDMLRKADNPLPCESINPFDPLQFLIEYK